MELLVTLGKETATRQVKVWFLVIDCLSLYNCILGIPTLAEFTIVPSTVHLKMKFYTKRGRVATIHSDLSPSRRCFKRSVKGKEYDRH